LFLYRNTFPPGVPTRSPPCSEARKTTAFFESTSCSTNISLEKSTLPGLTRRPCTSIRSTNSLKLILDGSSQIGSLHEFVQESSGVLGCCGSQPETMLPSSQVSPTSGCPSPQ